MRAPRSGPQAPPQRPAPPPPLLTWVRPAHSSKERTVSDPQASGQRGPWVYKKGALVGLLLRKALRRAPEAQGQHVQVLVGSAVVPRCPKLDHEPVACIGRAGGPQWSGCNVRVRLWPRLPHGRPPLLSFMRSHSASTVREL